MTHGTTDGATFGSTVGTTHGTTAATGEDGTIRSAIGVRGDGTALGTTAVIGAHIIHGTRTTQDGTEDSARIWGMVPDSDTEDISRATRRTPQDTRRRTTDEHLPAQKRRPQEGLSARAAAPDVAQSEEVRFHAAARQHRNRPEALRPQGRALHRRQADRPHTEGLRHHLIIQL